VPCLAFQPGRTLLALNSCRERSWTAGNPGSATSSTTAPAASPRPSGPPFGMYFSRGGKGRAWSPRPPGRKHAPGRGREIRGVRRSAASAWATTRAYASEGEALKGAFGSRETSPELSRNDRGWCGAYGERWKSTVLALREDRVVAPEADAGARMEPRPALAHDDHPGLDLLSAKIFTPSRLDCESRPFLRNQDLFLCAMASSPPSCAAPLSWLPASLLV